MNKAPSRSATRQTANHAPEPRSVAPPNREQESEAGRAELYPRVYLYRRIVQSKLFIDANFSTRIDLDAISEQACFSKFHFLRLFKKIYGKAPHQYLSGVRIEQAKALLEEGVSVTEVCFAVGFDSLSSFIGLFKRSVGVTPLTYQSQQQRRKAEASRVPLRFIPSCFGGKTDHAEESNFEEAPG
jgi:AraC-like DNA-binding protein